ncbi:MAG TPA: hypothetical protein VGQ97_04665, partial [Xanthobacteraceae bacterium]|nr:hypothetical protein [Xanthobacteraceae bacterium]
VKSMLPHERGRCAWIPRVTRVIVMHSFVALRTEREAAAELQRSATHFAAFQYPPEETLSCQTS